MSPKPPYTAPSHAPAHTESHDPSRRDFMMLTAATVAAVGAGSAVWPFINSMNPAADVLALASIEVDLTPIAEGQTLKVKWRGVPVFIRHRTKADIEEARSVDVTQLPDPQADADRVKEGKDQWLVMVGVCTHLGCIPIGGEGEFGGPDKGGYFCPCHGSQYDTAGRIRKGPAPRNLDVPQYSFLTDTRIKIG